MLVKRRSPAIVRSRAREWGANLRPYANAGGASSHPLPGHRLAPATDAGRGEPLRRQRILVVEDEALVAMATSQLLEDAGYEVVGMAADTAQAMRLADAERPDLVLMDIRLRGGDDGIDTAAQIRGRFGLRILYVSAHGDPATMARAARTDPAGFVGKPHTTDELLAAVGRALTN